ncbi:DUF6084 family protein [Actinomadura sp. 9N407]|uniref:DUF6084 family protein n=1 Tax=Actinomadura sp. 9N407 TaxID=3375154 RepID=UPI0037BD1D66
MADLHFTCTDVRPDPYAAAPTLVFRMRAIEMSGMDVRSIALRCQLRILPRQREYSRDEAARLSDLFGTRERWPSTLNPLRFAEGTVTVPKFRDAVEFELPVPCSYDLEVACGRYFHALDDGEIPMVMLFSGTLFTRDDIAMIPWDRECEVRVPVQVWQELIERHFPGGGWLRLNRDTVNALLAFKQRRDLPTWDQAIETLLREGGAHA